MKHSFVENNSLHWEMTPQADAKDEAVAPVAEEKKAWLPNPRDGEHVFGVAHIFASFNDTFVVSTLNSPKP